MDAKLFEKISALRGGVDKCITMAFSWWYNTILSSLFQKKKSTLHNKRHLKQKCQCAGFYETAETEMRREKLWNSEIILIISQKRDNWNSRKPPLTFIRWRDDKVVQEERNSW